ncbi:unnamed protein product [Prunus armeniaca]|uniref:Uncharacterized protein n=1 Tax=Prunus armeniaca TaxID=36596 RepID=A0A6J5THV1_PRUAR|nr:unnamed protein product [Prunus armeniaca]
MLLFLNAQMRTYAKEELKTTCVVRSIDFQEATLGDIVASLKSKLFPNFGKFIPPILLGVEPPDPGLVEDKMEDILGDEMDDDHGDNFVPHITINLDAARLKKQW